MRCESTSGHIQDNGRRRNWNRRQFGLISQKYITGSFQLQLVNRLTLIFRQIYYCHAQIELDPTSAIIGLRLVRHFRFATLDPQF